MEPSSKTSVLEGDGICMSRILSRASSLGKSSRVFYRSGEGVPFRWERQPGTPKNPRDDEDVVPPICPSPLMQCIGLPLPNLDHDDDDVRPPSKMWRFREMVRKGINGKMLGRSSRSKQQESSRVSSICPSFSASRSVIDLSMVDGPICCSPWNIPVILDEGNTRIYYCSQHKNAYAVEEDDLFLSRILTGVSSAEFSGSLYGDSLPAEIPFGWELHPGTPKASPENEIIPVPTPPPAVQSLSLQQPAAGRDKPNKSTWKKAWFWIRRSEKKEEPKKLQKEISFRYDDASLRKSVSASSSSRVLRFKRNLQGKLLSRGTWNARDNVVFARKKWNLFKS